MKSTPRTLAVYVLAAVGGFFLHRWGFADRGTAAEPREGTVASGGKKPPHAKRPSSGMLPDFHFATLTELKAIGAALQKAPDADIVDGISGRRGLPKIIALFLAEGIMQMPASARSSALRQARNAAQKDVLELMQHGATLRTRRNC